MAAANQSGRSGIATPPSTPPAADRTQVLNGVLSLATLFGTCVEAFGLIFPSKDSDHDQKVALAKLGVQQGRLLIFGDTVGISSPPATIARHMVPSHPGATNPDPHLPINFAVRDARLDDAATNRKVRTALDEIAGRPAHLSREELMEKYGLKTPKKFQKLEYPALDTNRLEACREKYALLLDLVQQMGAPTAPKRTMSITAQRWTVNDVDKFDDFVSIVKVQVDELIKYFGVKEQVDRGMRTDIRAMGWHPDMSGLLIRSDWEKLKLIREACYDDYPEYVESTEVAINYLNEELKGTGLAHIRQPLAPVTPRRKSSETGVEKSVPSPQHKEKRPGFLSNFKFKSLGKSHRDTPRERTKSIASTTCEDPQDPQRSLSESKPRSSEEANTLQPVRSLSMSAVPDGPAEYNLDSKLETVPTHDDSDDVGPLDKNPLLLADTAHSLIDRHDMYKGVGRIETKDIRNKAHDWAS